MLLKVARDTEGFRSKDQQKRKVLMQGYSESFEQKVPEYSKRSQPSRNWSRTPGTDTDVLVEKESNSKLNRGNALQ